jgi:hypothetical protein
MPKKMLPLGLLVAMAVLSASAPARGQPKQGPPVILDNYSSWRAYHQLRPPVMQTAEGPRPILLSTTWLNGELPPAPAGWTKSEFEDVGWFRGTIPWMIKSPWLSHLSLRGRFMVSDPGQVQGLALSLEYHGGVVVYVNGQEAFRRNLPEGPVTPDTLAEAYPKEAFVTETGEPLFPEGMEINPPKVPRGSNWGVSKTRKPSEESARRIGLWRRSADNVPIPSNLLRKGVNVLGIEVVRSAYDAVIEEIKNTYQQPERDVIGYQIYFCPCEIERVVLRSGSPAGIVSNAVRPAGFQVWNTDPAAPILDMEFGDPCEGVKPISLVGPRGGTYSGKVAVGDNKPIRGLRGTVTDLVGPAPQGFAVAGPISQVAAVASAIPASRISVRYGFEWGQEDIAEGMRHAPWPYTRLTNLIGGIGDTAQDEYPVRSPRGSRRGDGGPEPVDGAVSAVWVTVSIPGGAKPGLYKGMLTVEADGQKPVPVPVEMKVVDWELPLAKDFVSLVDTIESPDTLALEYKVEPWSEKHWEMIGRSMDFQGQVGTWTLYVPLIGHTNLGNEESMVRWVKKPGGDGNQYEYDFSILDRYLDTAEKHRGKPRIIILDVWDLYMLENGGKLPKGEEYDSARHIRDPRMTENVLAVGGKIDLGPMVTELDPATRKTRTLELPHLGEPVSKGLWEPMLKQLQERLRKRGWDKTVMLGLHTDAWARKATVQFFNDILPGTPWVVQSHDGFEGKLMHDLVPIGFQTRVWGTKYGDNNLVGRQGMEVKPALGVEVDGRLYGWRRQELVAQYERTPYLKDFPAVRWRFYVETQTTGDQRGVGRLGADLWPVLKNKNGERQGLVWSRYPESDWRNLCIYNYLLAPGPKGPGTTTRFEAFREGLQEAEARIAIEKALLDPALAAKLGPDLVKKCRQSLDARLARMFQMMSNLQMIGGGNDAGSQYATGWRWAGGPYGQVAFIGSGWQQRTEELYALAGEVARKLGAAGGKQ